MLVYGTDSFAKIVRECANASGTDVKGFFSNNDNQELKLENVSIIGPYSREVQPEEPVLIAVEDNLIRKTLVPGIGHKFASVIHPHAILSRYFSHEEGCIIFQGVVIQAGTTLGKHCIINTGVKLDYDCSIGDFVSIASGAIIGGDVSIGEGVAVGPGAIVSPKVKIGKWSVISAGAVVTEDVPEYVVVEGIPAKIVKKLTQTV